MAQLLIDPEDPNFFRHALRVGTWERYEHPTKGETLTLQIGQFPVISIHAIMVDGPHHPTESLLNDLKNPMTVALLLTKLASLQEQVQIAADIIAEQAGKGGAQDYHRWIKVMMGDGSFSFVCSCGTRVDDFLSADACEEAAARHAEVSGEGSVPT